MIFLVCVWGGGAGNGLRCFRKLSRIDWLGPDGGGHALWPRKWSQGTLPPHFLLRLSATVAPRLAFSFSQQTLRPFLVSVPPPSSTLFALTPAMWSYGSADIPILWVKRWRELDGGGGGGRCCLIPPFTPPTIQEWCHNFFFFTLVKLLQYIIFSLAEPPNWSLLSDFIKMSKNIDWWHFKNPIAPYLKHKKQALKMQSSSHFHWEKN